LLEVLWDGIASSNAIPGPTDAQKIELDSRLADHLAHPDDLIPWHEVKAAALAQLS
jgi:putative addiction module component (TIGR02574 family)